MSPKFLRRVTRTVALVSAVAVALTACGGASSDSAAGDGTVKWAFTIPPDWDPVLTSSHYPRYYTNLVHEPLLAIDEQGQPGPWQL